MYVAQGFGELGGLLFDAGVYLVDTASIYAYSSYVTGAALVGLDAKEAYFLASAALGVWFGDPGQGAMGEEKGFQIGDFLGSLKASENSPEVREALRGAADAAVDYLSGNSDER
jgi:aryl-alcohol dehydrogenase-like predicted oxidoreductase